MRRRVRLASLLLGGAGAALAQARAALDAGIVSVDGSVHEVKFDAWMYPMDDKVMLNKAPMSRCCVHLGEVTLSFHRP